MNPQKKSNTRLEDLPNDLLSEIMAKVGSHSREDLGHCMLACTELLGAVDDPKVYKNLDMSPLLTTPMEGNGKYRHLLLKGLQYGNPAAQYVRGMLEYFVHGNPDAGLQLLKQSANASFEEAMYLYGIIKLCMGDTDHEGSRYMDMLQWRQDTKRAEKCWTTIKATMTGMWIIRKPVYWVSLFAMTPPFGCNVGDMDNTCEKCFLYKMMFRFILNF